MKKQDKEMPDTNLHDISEELKTQLDEYLERVTGSYCISEEKSDREYTVDQEAIAGILDCTLKDGIHPAAFYVYEELVQALLNHLCAPAAYPSVFQLLSALKTRLWASPLMQVSDIIRERFFEYLYYLSPFTKSYFEVPDFEEPGYFSDPASVEREDHIKTYLGYHQMMLNTYSCDLPMLEEIWSGNPLEVQCSQCGSVITETGEPLRFFRQEYEEKSEKEDMKEEWDVFHTMMPWLNKCGEKQLNPFLRLVYGTYHCPVCGEENIVLEAYKNLRYQPMDLRPEPETELVEWLIQFGESKLHENWYKELFLHKQALAYMFCKKQPEPLLLARCISRVATDYSFVDEFRLELKYAEWAVSLLESLPDEIYGNDKALQLAEAYRRLGVACSADYQHPKNNFPERSAECYEKALKMFDELLGAGNEKSANVKINMINLKLSLKQDASKEIEMVKEQIEIDKKRENPDEDEIATSYKRIAEAYADCMSDHKQAAYYYDFYLQWAKKEYGDESDFVADCYDELAEIYETGGDFKSAGKYCEMALKINIREMGRIYMLPPLLKKSIIGILKKVGKIDEDDKFDRCISVSENYVHMGDLQVKSRNLKKAIKSYGKAITLREYVLPKPTYRLGRIYQRLGRVYKELCDRSSAQREFDRAVEIYRQTIDDNMAEKNSQYDAIQSMEIEDCENAIRELRSDYY
ncbi:MAG: tetratricopeptide repeat protein [Acetatifactor sp.]|nr:tetratricopeptide repeat protein [Acetatifactor sp.]